LESSPAAETFDRLLATHAYDPSQPDDRNRIERQPNAEAILAALGKTGTARCRDLSEELPPAPRQRKGVVQSMSCPEWRLMAHLITPEDFEITPQSTPS
jgi:hypothetical protein